MRSEGVFQEDTGNSTGDSLKTQEMFSKRYLQKHKDILLVFTKKKKY